jgi:vitamin B12 transporter
VLVDGVVVNDPGGDIDLAHITLENVERIEIVRGPASALYGSHAMTGVIQIFTKQGRGPASLSASARAGTFDTREGEGTLSAGSERVGGTVAAFRTQTDGILAFNNRYRNTAAGGTLRFTPDERTDARLALRWRDGVFHFPTDGNGNVVDRNAFREERRFLASLDAGRRFGERIEGRLLLGYNDARLTNDDAQDDAGDTQGFYAFFSRTAVRRASADARVNVHLPSAVVLTGGAELVSERERTESASQSEFGPFVTPRETADRLNRALYGQLFANVGRRLTLTTGGRVEDNEAFGSFATYRASAGIRVGAGARLRASIASAFKAPTVLEHYGTAGFVLGNPELDPERSRSWEAGIDQELGRRAMVSLTYFDQRFRDMIQIVPAPGGASTYANLDRASSRGVELEATTMLHTNLTARGSASWLRTRNEETGERLLRRPGFLASLTTTLRGSRGSLATTIMHNGRRDDLDFSDFPAPRVRLDPFTTVELAGELRVIGGGTESRAMHLTLRALNLFDEQYEQVLNFDAPGRTILVGARVDVGW